MRLVLRLFGVTVIDLDATDSPDIEPDVDWSDLSGGTLASIPVGFIQPEPAIEYEDE